MERFLRKKLWKGEFTNVSRERSAIMRAIKGKHNKTTDEQLRMLLVRRGVSGWKMHPQNIEGKPDIYFPSKKRAIFIDGCFWHGCPQCGHVPKTRRPFWSAKIKRNKERDKKANRKLRRQGINVLRFWEHAIKLNGQAQVEKVLR